MKSELFCIACPTTFSADPSRWETGMPIKLPPLAYYRARRAPVPDARFFRPGWMSLMDAFQRLGEERYGDRWTGREISARDLSRSVLPDEAAAIRELEHEFLVGPNSLGLQDNPFGEQKYSVWTSLGIIRTKTEEEALSIFREDRANCDRDRAAEQEERQRFETVRDEIRMQCWEKGLSIALFDPETGASDRLTQEFIQSCRMDELLDTASRCEAGRPLSEHSRQIIIVELAPRVVEKDEGQQQFETVTPGEHKKDPKPLSPAELTKWINVRAAELNGSPSPTFRRLWAEIKAEFPVNTIARDRFREAIANTQLHCSKRGRRSCKN